MTDSNSHYVYILRCADGTLYTGYTTDLDRRCREHNRGDGAKYTAGRRPVELMYHEEFSSRSAACRREHEIKQFSKSRKEKLLARSIHDNETVIE